MDDLTELQDLAASMLNGTATQEDIANRLMTDAGFRNRMMNNPMVQQMLSQQGMNTNMLNNAMGMLNLGASSNSNSSVNTAESNFKQAVQLYRAKKYDEALKKLEATIPLLESGNNNALIGKAYALQGDIHNSKQQLDDAILSYKAAHHFWEMTDDKWKPIANSKIIAVQLKQAVRAKDPTQAKTIFEEIVELINITIKMPGCQKTVNLTGDLYRDLATACLHLGDEENSEAALNSAINAYEDNQTKISALMKRVEATRRFLAKDDDSNDNNKKPFMLLNKNAFVTKQGKEERKKESTDSKKEKLTETDNSKDALKKN